ncbi:MAG TPA: ECF-type sigma factor [Pyrinomonadaceae bacterium]|nr:ECF-type sigma factor [Pyrinomonadaceae bacterium]
MHEITELLKAWNEGDEEALDKLMPLVVEELKKIAHRYMSAERPGNILQTTALVNEALIKLIPEKLSFENRKQFYALVAKRMRQVLVDDVRKQSTVKRGKWRIEQLDDLHAKDLSSERSWELMMLDEALTKLAETDERQATIVECHFFIGLTIAEIAELLGLSKTTVERDWNFARAWLKLEMTGKS